MLYDRVKNLTLFMILKPNVYVIYALWFEH